MGSYNASEAVNKNMKASSPGWGMGSSKRVFFTETAAKAKKIVPSPGEYNTNQDIIHKRITTRRR